MQIPQQRASFPQGLSEETLKEALQVPCIWVESQDLQETRCQEVEREVGIAVAEQLATPTVYNLRLSVLLCR